MNKLIAIIPVALLLTSCATIMNRNVERITVKSDKRIQIVSIDSSRKFSGDRKGIYVERGKHPIKIQVLVDSTQKTVLVKSHSSLAFWANIYFNYGVGMLVDKDNPRRYDYPRRIFLQLKDSNLLVRRFAPTPKGTCDWHIALPHANLFYVKTIDGHRASGGYWGIESGFDYYYKDNRFLSVYAGAATDYLIPVPAAVDIWGEYQNSLGLFLNLRDNYTLGSFNLGYGLSYSKLSWRRAITTDPTFKPQIRSNSALGLSFSSSYRFGEHFHLGLLYQPYFIRIDNKTVADYQHQISLELIWKVPLAGSGRTVR